MDILIRDLTQTDSSTIAAAFKAQGWNKPAEQYDQYWNETQSGKRDVLVAEVNGEFAGYVTIMWRSYDPIYREAGIPEVVDFNVLIRFQKRGIGSKLMDEAEGRVQARGYRTICIQVGLTADYGAAQTLYVKRHYVLDGRGLLQDGRPISHGEQITVDDYLTLAFTKALTDPR